jgi:hypothetical protein
LADHADLCPKAGGGHCLVRAFSTEKSLEVLTNDCHTGNWKASSTSNQIEIDAPYNNYWFGAHEHFVIGC